MEETAISTVWRNQSIPTESEVFRSITKLLHNNVDSHIFRDYTLLYVSLSLEAILDFRK